jgi:hypothetical protein
MCLHVCPAITVPSNGNHVKCALANTDGTLVIVSADIVASVRGCKHNAYTQGITLVFSCAYPELRLGLYRQT